MAQVKHIQSPYSPRRAFMPFHERRERWACLVVHRRAGKTVSVVNDLIKRAVEKKAPYAYFAPFRSQAKAVAWDYFKLYTQGVQKAVNEAELKITLVTGSTLHLFGADNADAARGMGFGGLACDEYGDFRPSVWGNVLRPTLSDRQGWAVFMGTPKGHNQFYKVHREAVKNTAGNWFSMMLKASGSRLLAPEELRDARRQLLPDQYNQEYECSFDAAILGAYYGAEMSRVDLQGRICEVSYDPAFPVNTAWDVGYRDDTAIWLYQNIGDEIHLLDCIAASGVDLPYFVEELKKRGYQYGRHWLPHDARAKTLASGGKSIIERLATMLGPSSLAIVPNLKIQDGIDAVRRALDRCWFDRKCDSDLDDENDDLRSGVEALRQYQREYNEDTRAFSKNPLHNWASHYADAFRMMAVAERRPDVVETVAKRPFLEEFPDINKLTLDELWAEKEAREAEYVRI